MAAAAKSRNASSSAPAVQVWGIMTCNSTRKALKYYEARKVPFAFKDLKLAPPPKTLLRAALKEVDSPRKLFNTSGKAYQEGNFKAKIPSMSKDEIIDVLVKDPMLIKRPLVRGANGVTVGYDEETLRRVV